MITLDTHPNAPCIARVVNDDGRDILVQMDFDYPGIASTFGWNIRDVQADDVCERKHKCDHRGTDGTVNCPDCGVKAGQFIESAADFIDDNDGKTAEDPGYFD